MGNRKKISSGELALIARIRASAAAHPAGRVSLGIGDDCAILRPPAGHELLVTTDFSLEGRHFRRDWHIPQSIGHRTLARGLSDIASMGGKPLAAFLSLALPKSVAKDPAGWIAFSKVCWRSLPKSSVPLAGGDTAESPSNEILADIILIGSAPSGRALTRSGARPGDALYCTGALGGAAAELAALGKSPAIFRRARASGDHPHLFPQPRLAVGAALLRRKLATACIDISDGLSTDLAHLCEASRRRCRTGRCPAPRASAHRRALPAQQMAAILHGGEDYELLFTARPNTKIPRSIAGVPITRIGRIVPTRKSRPRMTIVAEGTRFELQPRGWEHLR